ALLLIVANVAWFQIFRITEREPRARQSAQQLVSVVNLTRAALITAQPSKRFDLLADLSRSEGIQVHLADPGEVVPPLPDRPYIQALAAELRRGLGPDTRIALSRHGVRGMWVSFPIDDDEYWVYMPRSRVDRNVPVRWLGWGVLVLLLALAGAYAIVARINQPLRQLTRGAAQMGRGATPTPVEETGPEEIRTLARAFNQLAADLKRLDDERALLLAGVSHDLRTPLSRIRLGVEMLDSQADAALKAGIEQDIEDIDAAINQFLDFARLASPEALAADTDLNAIVRGLAERYAKAGKPIRVASEPLPPLALRPSSIQRLLGNLIDNALRHGSPDVEVATGRTANGVYIEVRDRGPGIPPDEAERMLQPFTRLNAARSGSGTGLGLAIVDRIARMHGGSVQLLPRSEGGLRVRVELPASPPLRRKSPGTAELAAQTPKS
ncbi:MAG TPA: ATP-binding protein, partial [Burkholderiales bacterium]|nr:ATP-binding protein [Burkholderiales bacterium]